MTLPSRKELEIIIELVWCQSACVHARSLLSCLTVCNPMDYSPSGSSVHGILQARIVKWVAISSSRGSSRPSDCNHISYVSCIGRWVLYHYPHLHLVVKGKSSHLLSWFPDPPSLIPKLHVMTTVTSATNAEEVKHNLITSILMLHPSLGLSKATNMAGGLGKPGSVGSSLCLWDRKKAVSLALSPSLSPVHPLICSYSHSLTC